MKTCSFIIGTVASKGEDVMIQKKTDTPESKAFWDFMEKTAAEVETWPCWKRLAGTNITGGEFRKCKNVQCETCWTHEEARAVLSTYLFNIAKHRPMKGSIYLMKALAYEALGNFDKAARLRKKAKTC